MARKQKEKPPAFQFYARDWLASTRVRLMGRDVRGDYVDLLSHQWLAGSLPEDPDDIRELLARPRNEWPRVWSKLEAHFPAGPDGLRRNPRLEVVREELETYSDSQRTRARKRWANGGEEHADA